MTAGMRRRIELSKVTLVSMAAPKLKDLAAAKMAALKMKVPRFPLPVRAAVAY